MHLKSLRIGLMMSGFALVATPAIAQEAAEPAPPAAGENIPPVDVVQKPKAAKKKAAKQAAPAAKKKAVAKQAPAAVAEPAPQPPPPVADTLPPADTPATANAAEYPPGGQGAAARAYQSATGPIDPTRGVAPADLSRYSGSATRVDRAAIDQLRPKDNHEILARIPGVTVVNDDGMARHIGIGVRGSPPRRARKVLVLEDGQPINFSPFLDPSTHYTPPTERVEAVEVIKGVVTPYGPLTNHGVVNFRNLNPFGANETVIQGAIGYTEHSQKSVNNMRHVHTRQNIGNVGVVASYSGGESAGAWDNEVLRYNDFHGAIGFRGTNQDLTISGGFFRQRDRYDEDNWGELGDAEFFRNGWRKKNPLFDGFEAPFGRELSSYNADLYRLQAAHNYYFDRDTTLSTRAYLYDQRRARFFPDGEVIEEEGGTDLFMAGRDRRYQQYGVDSRLELARRSLFGLRQDIQVGVRYQHDKFSNIDREGDEGEVLDFDNVGDRGEYSRSKADAFAAFFQTTIHLSPVLTVTPGVRYEGYDIDFRAFDDDGLPDGTGKSNHDFILPAISVAWQVAPKTTIFGGYHRGVTPHVLRDATEEGTDGFPLREEVGDNFEVGMRTAAIRGLSFETAYFHSRIDDYQIKEAFTIEGDNVYGTMDKVEINGVELGARLNSRPFTGGPWNFFGEVTYTYARSIIERGFDQLDEGDPLVSVAGNRVPEVPEHWAVFTLGAAHHSGWDASVSYRYLGDFFVDTFNTVDGEDDGGLGLVDDVWLLSANVNYTIPNTNLTLFASGTNLTDELYIADRADGAKPGQARTLWGGFKYKF
jgi:Fe(3+) dicitrate transport protein